MQPSISHSERFKADCERYRNAIELTTDPHAKNTLSNLLVKLVSEARRIDQFYSELSTGSGIISHVEESRSSLTGIRKELEKLCAPLKL